MARPPAARVHHHRPNAGPGVPRPGPRHPAAPPPQPLLHAVAGRAPSAPLRFLSPRPASPADRTRWTNTSAYIDTLMASAEHWPETRPLIIGSTARLLAATILVVFPNTWDTDPAARD